MNARKLEKHMKPLLETTLDICKDRLKQNPQKYQKSIKVPLRDSNGQLLDMNMKTEIDHVKLGHDVKSDLKNRYDDNSYDLLCDDLKSLLIQNNYKTNVSSPKLYLNYAISYAIKNSENNTKKLLDKTIFNFVNYIKTDVGLLYYLIPLYNVDGDFTKIILSNNLWIRKITDAEYSYILNIQKSPHDTIPPYQLNLKCVLICKHERIFGAEKKIISNNEHILGVLKLFNSGDPIFGGLYSRMSDTWDIGTLKNFSWEPIKQSTSNTIQLNPVIIKKLRLFYKNIYDRFSENDRLTILYALRRFGLAHDHNDDKEKILDYVIALESLLTTGAGDTSIKIAHRMSALLSNNDDQMLEIWNFSKNVYQLRNSIVHGMEYRKKSRNQIKDIDLEKITVSLQRYSQIAILRIHTLLDKHLKHKNILNELDASVYDRKKLRKLRSIWK